MNRDERDIGNRIGRPACQDNYRAGEELAASHNS